MTAVDFSRYDPKRVKQYMFHLMEANRASPSVSRPKQTTRHIGEVFHAGYQRATPRGTDEVKEHIQELNKKINDIEAKFEKMIDLVQKNAQKTKQQKVQPQKKQETPKPKVQEFNPVEETKTTVQVEHEKRVERAIAIRQLEQLEDMYSKLEHSGTHSLDDLDRVKNKIDKLKKQIQ